MEEQRWRRVELMRPGEVLQVVVADSSSGLQVRRIEEDSGEPALLGSAARRLGVW